MPFSQIIPPSPSESKSPLYTYVSFFPHSHLDSGTSARKLTSNPDGRYSRELIIELGGFKRNLGGLNNQDWRLFWDTAEKEM